MIFFISNRASHNAIRSHCHNTHWAIGVELNELCYDSLITHIRQRIVCVCVCVLDGCDIEVQTGEQNRKCVLLTLSRYLLMREVR